MFLQKLLKILRYVKKNYTNDFFHTESNTTVQET